MKTGKVIAVGLILGLLLFITTVYGSGNAPYWPKDAWRTSTPEEQGIDSRLIDAMLAKVKDEKINLHSFQIIRHGYLVSEVYFHPYQRSYRGPLYSCTKSITSALVGIAIKEGDLKGIGQPVYDLFLDQNLGEIDPIKQQITIGHLLTMSSGLKAVTTYQFNDKSNPVNYLLNLPRTGTPGQTFEYSCAGPHLLSALVKYQTGSDTLFYARQKLFEPMGISGVTWEVDPQGVHYGSTGIRMTATDMAKFGYLYLHRGQWNGEQLIPAGWVKTSTRKYIETPTMNEAENTGYGYCWWVDSAWDGFSAHGFGGQYIFVVPKLDLVVVFTAGLENPQFPIPKKLMEKYLIPAIHPKTLPANPEENQKLAVLIDELQNPKPEAVPPLPEIANRVADQTYGCPQNVLTVNTFRLKCASNQATLQLTLVPDPSQTIEIPVGLDNLFRYSNQAMVGEIYAKGKWVDAKTFEITMIRPLDQLNLRVYFDDNEAVVEIMGSDQKFSGTIK